MLKRLSVKGRLYLIILLVVFIFSSMMWSAISNGNKIGEIGLEKTRSAMLAGQKEKLIVATHSLALAIGHSIEGISDKQEQITMIRKMVNDIRFQVDESGYYFVYEGTTNVAHPTIKSNQGKDFGGAKDKNGVAFVRELMEQAEKGGGFVEFVYSKPPENLDTPKLGYSELIPGIQMWIGTGIYIEGYEAQWNEKPR